MNKFGEEWDRIILRESATKKMPVLIVLGMLILCGFYRKVRLGPELSFEVRAEILNQYDPMLQGPEDGSIHILQMMSGTQAVRYYMTFMKSLLWHRNLTRNPAPIHLHLITDQATRIIMEPLLLTWRLPHLRITFYASEKFQEKIVWMHSQHWAAHVVAVRMYLSEIFNSTVPKILDLDSDTLFMGDVADLWNLFDQFSEHQIFGMAREQVAVQFNFRKFKGITRTYGYNAGVLLWNLKKLPVAKWEAIWKPSFSRTHRLSPEFRLAEQTLLNVIALENPDILFELPCYWNVQLNELAHSDWCNTTWNSREKNLTLTPQLFHINGCDKREAAFTLIPIQELLNSGEDFKHNYLVERSRIIQLDGYRFQDTAHIFDFREILLRIHPEDSKVNSNLLKPNSSSGGTFPLHHRIHPAYFYGNYKQLTGDNEGVTLVHGLHYSRHAFDKFRELTNSWSGHQSVAFYASDLEAHELLGLVFNSPKIFHSQNIAIHVIYKKEELAANLSTIHNMAVVFAQTKMILKAKLTPPAYLSALYMAASKLSISLATTEEINIFLDWNSVSSSDLELYNYKCAKSRLRFCVLTIKQNEYFNFTTSLKRAVVGVLMPRAYGLLPDMENNLSEDETIITLITNFLASNRFLTE